MWGKKRQSLGAGELAGLARKGATTSDSVPVIKPRLDQEDVATLTAELSSSEKRRSELRKAQIGESEAMKWERQRALAEEIRKSTQLRAKLGIREAEPDTSPGPKHKAALEAAAREAAAEARKEMRSAHLRTGIVETVRAVVTLTTAATFAVLDGFFAGCCSGWNKTAMLVVGGASASFIIYWGYFKDRGKITDREMGDIFRRQVHRDTKERERRQKMLTNRNQGKDRHGWKL